MTSVGDSATGPADAYAAILHDLMALYPSLPALEVQPKYARVAHIGHGWYMRVHRGCEAVLVLREAGYAAESWPLRRSVSEHVGALKWLAVEGEKVHDPIVRWLGNQATRRKEASTLAGWTTPDYTVFDEVIADGADAQQDRDQDTYSRFTHLFRDYGDPSDLSSWLIETANSHPGWESAAPYIDLGPPLTLRDEPGVTDRDDEGWAVMSLWEALHAMNSIMRDAPWDDELQSTHARIDELAAAWLAAQVAPLD